MTDHDIDRRVGPLLERGETIQWRGASWAVATIARRIPILCVMICFTLYPLAVNGKSAWAVLDFDFAALKRHQIVWMAIIGIPLLITLRNMVRDTPTRWAISNRRIYRIIRSSVTATELSRVVSVEIRRPHSDRGTIIAVLPEHRDSDGHMHKSTLDISFVHNARAAHAAIQDGIRHVAQDTSHQPA